MSMSELGRKQLPRKYTMLALELDGLAIKGVPMRRRDDKMLEVAVTSDPWAVRALLPSECAESLMLRAVRGDPDVLFALMTPRPRASARVIQAALEGNGMVLRHCAKQSERMVAVAAKQNPHALSFATCRLSEKLLESVLKSNGMALAHIKDRTPRMCAIAAYQNPHALSLMPDSPDEIVGIAVRQDPSAISYVDNPSPAIQTLAVAENPAALRWIGVPTAATIQLASELGASEEILSAAQRRMPLPESPSEDRPLYESPSP